MEDSRKQSNRSQGSADSPSKTTQLSPPSSTSGLEDIDIIGYEQISIDPQADIQTLARNTLQNAFSEATYGQSGDRFVYGNPLGLELVAGKDRVNSRLDALEAESLAHRVETVSHRAEIAALGEKVAQNQIRIQHLAAAGEGYFKIRQRFLDVFRRDVLQDPAAQWTPMISAGNAAAHHGDAITDAGLFESGARKDASLMVKVYGLTPAQVLSLRYNEDYDSISVLNARASRRVDRDNPIPQDVEDAWNTYINVLEQNWGRLPKEDPTSALGRAYYQFWNAHGKCMR